MHRRTERNLYHTLHINSDRNVFTCEDIHPKDNDDVLNPFPKCIYTYQSN